MQLCDHILFLVRVVHVKVEHLAERLRVFENGGQEKVQQRPKLMKVILPQGKKKNRQPMFQENRGEALLH